jgi:uncharacterized membrane protein YgcG
VSTGPRQFSARIPQKGWRPRPATVVIAGKGKQDNGGDHPATGYRRKGKRERRVYDVGGPLIAAVLVAAAFLANEYSLEPRTTTAFLAGSVVATAMFHFIYTYALARQQQQDGHLQNALSDVSPALRILAMALWLAAALAWAWYLFEPLQDKTLVCLGLGVLLVFFMCAFETGRMILAPLIMALQVLAMMMSVLSLFGAAGGVFSGSGGKFGGGGAKANW